MNNIQVLISGHTAKGAEIDKELSVFGVNAVIRTDFSEKSPQRLMQ